MNEELSYAELEDLDSVEFDTMELSLSDIECLGQYHEQADQLVFGEC